MPEAYRMTLSIMSWSPDTATAKDRIDQIETILGDDASILSSIEWLEQGAPPGAPGMPTVVPTLEAIDPRSVTVGGENFTLTLTGTGFDISAVIVFDGSDLMTQFVDEATVSADNVPVPAEAGSYEVFVRTVGGMAGPLPLQVDP